MFYLMMHSTHFIYGYMDPHRGIDPIIHRTMSECSYYGVTKEYKDTQEQDATLW